jgi:hypothetical protein
MTLARNQRHEHPRPHNHPEPDRRVVADAGAFQFGIGVTLLLALVWQDGLALSWPASWSANTTHAVTTPSTWTWAAAAAIPGASRPVAADRGRPGRAAGPARLGRRRGWPSRQPGAGLVRPPKTVLVTTYRQDGRPVGTPVSLAVDGDHADVRSFEKAARPDAPEQSQGGGGAVDGPGPADRPGHPGHGQTPGGPRVPTRRPPAGRQAPTAARRAGAVDPSPGSRQDRQDGPLPADTPRPWPRERRSPTDTRPAKEG